jgi:hypothetical protein
MERTYQLAVLAPALADIGTCVGAFGSQGVYFAVNANKGNAFAACSYFGNERVF